MEALLMKTFGFSHKPAPIRPSSPSAQDPILLVDDDHLHRTCLKEFLHLRGYRCLEACQGKEALEMIRQKAVSMIITDQNMPEMDGLTFIQQLNQAFPNEALPIFLITAELSHTVRLCAFKHGVNRVFEKPLDFQELCQAVDWVIKFDLPAHSTLNSLSS
jgi:two-component system chemotaxis response regulator CheY